MSDSNHIHFDLGGFRVHYAEEEAPFTEFDFERFRQTYFGFGRQTTTGTVPPSTLPYAVREACTLLGLAPTTKPTIEDIRGAFRAKVKQAADGKGGYTGDMDRLTKAKEQLIAFVKG